VAALLSVFLEKPIDFPNIEKATENVPFLPYERGGCGRALPCITLRDTAQRTANSPPVDL
jgi:hypothetical protein